MKTISIKVETVGEGIRAKIIVQDSRRNPYEAVIKYPLSSQPFYMLDGARHDLKEHEIKRLRETITEVRGGGR